MPITIYVLKLKYGKFYVGKTSDVVTRVFEHFAQDASSKASSWTSKYSPISIEDIIENCDDFDEDKYTKIYMAKYGIQNVRGGSYTQIVLREDQIDHLITEIRGAHNACYFCGSDAHYINDCPRLYMSNAKQKPLVNKPKYCNRCGRYGHWDVECYARSHANGRILYNKKKPGGAFSVFMILAFIFFGVFL
jgi:hypothetical protein